MQLGNYILDLATGEWVTVTWKHIKIFSEDQNAFFALFSYIEVTPDILRACGFTVSDDNLYAELLLYYKSRWKIEWYKNMLGFSICTGHKGLGTASIKYLHELQILYKLLSTKELNISPQINIGLFF